MSNVLLNHASADAIIYYRYSFHCFTVSDISDLSDLL